MELADGVGRSGRARTGRAGHRAVPMESPNWGSGRLSMRGSFGGAARACLARVDLPMSSHNKAGRVRVVAADSFKFWPWFVANWSRMALPAGIVGAMTIATLLVDGNRDEAL